MNQICIVCGGPLLLKEKNGWCTNCLTGVDDDDRDEHNQKEEAKSDTVIHSTNEC